MLKIDRLAKHFATVKAVDDVSLEIPEGQMVGVIGRSGAGKSTLLRLINRLIEPTHVRPPRQVAVEPAHGAALANA